MNRYPLWKYFIILFVVAVGVFYALPNLYPDDPAIQISSVSSSTSMTQSQMDRAVSALESAGIKVKEAEVGERNILIRLFDGEDQLPGKAAAG